MISVNNIFKIIRGTLFSEEINETKMFKYLKQRRTIIEQFKENSNEKIFKNNRFFQKTYNKFIIEGMPESLFKNGIILTRQSNDNDLTKIPFYHFIKAQSMMYVVDRERCLYTSYYQGNIITQKIKQNKTMIEYILSEIKRVYNKIPLKKSYKILLSNVLPLIEEDKLTYFLNSNNIKKNKTFTQQWQIERHIKAKNLIFELFTKENYTSIPESFTYEPILETLTKETFGEDIIFRPHLSIDKYFFQPFAIVKTSIIENIFNITINDSGYTLIFPTYSLPNDYKAKSETYSVQASFVKEYLIRNKIQASNFYTLIDYKLGFKMIEISDYKQISIPELPKTLNKENILKYKLFPFINKDSGYKRNHQEIAEEIQDLCLLTNIGPKKRRLLHDKQIYTLKQLYKAVKYNEVELPLLSIRFLEVNNQNKVPILPITINDKLPRFEDESFVDMEFAYDKSLDYTCIYNIGVLRVKNGTKKFDQLTIEKLNEDGEYELLDKFFKLVKGKTVIFHWNHTEKTMLKQAIERHEYPDDWELPECIDFYKIMKDNTIVVKDCYNLKLKSVAKAMKKNNLIEHYHEDIINGTDLSSRIIDMYETETYNPNDPFLKHVEEYNKDDIYTMYEIIEAIRTFYE